MNVPGDRFDLFGAIHPDTPDYKEVLSWLADHDVRGIKLHPDYQGTFLMISAWSASLIRPQNWGFIQWYMEGSILTAGSHSLYAGPYGKGVTRYRDRQIDRCPHGDGPYGMR